MLIVWAAAITLRNFTRNFLTFIKKLEEHRAFGVHSTSNMPDPPKLSDIGPDQSGSGLGFSERGELKEGELEEVNDDYDLSEQLR